MTVLVFLTSLLGAMAIGMPIATSLIVCGIALMLHLGIFDAQIVAQNVVGGADSYSLMAVPFFAEVLGRHLDKAVERVRDVI